MEVKVFTSDTCSYCHMVKEYLDEKGVEFEEKNVSQDSEARKELIANGFMGVPVVYIGDEVIQGFDKKKLDALLND